MSWPTLTIPIPEHLFEQAERLLVLFPKHRPRQTEIRRAISASYYGLFHFTLTRAADEYVGARYRADPRCALVYRSVSHSWLRRLCDDAAKPVIPKKYHGVAGARCFGDGIRLFALGMADLQDKRYAADYDPGSSFARRDGDAAIAAARNARDHFDSADPPARRGFLALLLFAQRGQV